MRNALNEVLRGEYVKDCEKGLARWNKTLADEGIGERLYLPHSRFHRHVGEYAGHHFDIEGNLISTEEFEQTEIGMAADDGRSRIRAQLDASGDRARKDRQLDCATGSGNQRQAVRI